METNRAYRAPRLVEYGPLAELTLGAGNNTCDFAIGHSNNSTGTSTDSGTGISNSSQCSALGGP
jgi:hypothetical protein